MLSEYFSAYRNISPFFMFCIPKEKVMKQVKLIIIALIALSLSGYSQINLIGARSNQGTGNMEVVKWQALNQSSVTIYPTFLQAYVFGSSVFDAYNGNYYLNGIGTSASGLFSFNSITNEQNISNFGAFSSIAEIDMSTAKIYTLSASVVDYISVNGYDINTGEVTLLGQIFEPGIQGIIADATGFDSNNGVLYYVGYDTLPSLCLYGIQVREPVFTYTKTTLIPTAPGNNISSVNYDNVNNTIFAMNAEYSALGNYEGNKVVEINKSTGEIVTRGNLTGFEAFMGGSSSFDQNTGSLLLVGFDANFAQKMIVFNTSDNTYTTGFVPGNVSEIVCDNTVFARNAYVVTSISENDKTSISVFPNPTGTRISISTTNTGSGEIIVSLFDINGKIVLQDRFVRKSQIDMDVSTLVKGIYLLKAESPEGITSTKIVIR